MLIRIEIKKSEIGISESQLEVMNQEIKEDKKVALTFMKWFGGSRVKQSCQTKTRMKTIFKKIWAAFRLKLDCPGK